MPVRHTHAVPHADPPHRHPHADGVCDRDAVRAGHAQDLRAWSAAGRQLPLFMPARHAGTDTAESYTNMDGDCVPDRNAVWARLCRVLLRQPGEQLHVHLRTNGNDSDAHGHPDPVRRRLRWQRRRDHR